MSVCTQLTRPAKIAGIGTAALLSLAALQAAPGGQSRPQPTAVNHTRLPNSLEVPVSYGGIGAEGVDLIWRGTTAGPLSGQATVRMAYAGSPEERGMPVWPVTVLLFFSADDYRSSFIAELSGTMDWTRGEMLLSGLVTDGPAAGIAVEQLLRLRDSKWNGSLMLRFQPPAAESVAAVTAKD